MSEIISKQTPKRQLGIILAIVFFGFLGLSMPYLIFPSLFLDPSHSMIPSDWSESSRSLFLGITLAAYPLGQFFGSPILGAFSDDYGRRKIMSGSLLVSGGCTLLTALSIEGNVLWLLISSRFVAGLMEGNLAIARSMAADIKQLSKHETFGKINAAASVAYILGPLLGGLLSDKSVYSHFTLSTPFFIMCVLFLCLSLASFFMVAEKPISARISKRSIWERINFVQRFKVLFRNKKLKFLLVMVSLFTLAVDIFYEFGPVYLTVKWMISPLELAIYNGMLCVGLAIGNGWLAAVLSKHYSVQTVVSLAMIGFAITIMGIVFVDQHLLMLLFFLGIGFTIAIVTTNLTVQVSDAVSEKIQGEVMGVQTSIRVLGDALICLLGGVLLLISSKIILIVAAGIVFWTVSCYLRKPSLNGSGFLTIS